MHVNHAGLVLGPAARGVQDSDARSPVLVRSCLGIPCRWLPAGHRRSSKATACVLLTRGLWLSTEPPAASETGPLQLWPQECGGRLTKGRIVILQCRRSLKTFLFRQSNHGALWNFLFSLRRVEIFVQVYLLTYYSLQPLCWKRNQSQRENISAG